MTAMRPSARFSCLRWKQRSQHFQCQFSTSRRAQAEESTPNSTATSSSPTTTSSPSATASPHSKLLDTLMRGTQSASPSRNASHSPFSSPSSSSRTTSSPTRQATLDNLNMQARRREMQRFQTRRWQAGSVYAPHDLSGTEMQKRRRPRSVDRDVFDILGINPLNEYKNFAMMSEFCTRMGMIKPRSATGLRRVNQRRLSKAIRRAVGMGLMPSVHKHPEILEMERRSANTKWL